MNQNFNNQHFNNPNFNNLNCRNCIRPNGCCCQYQFNNNCCHQQCFGKTNQTCSTLMLPNNNCLEIPTSFIIHTHFNPSQTPVSPLTITPSTNITTTVESKKAVPVYPRKNRSHIDLDSITSDENLESIEDISKSNGENQKKRQRQSQTGRQQTTTSRGKKNYNKNERTPKNNNSDHTDICDCAKCLYKKCVKLCEQMRGLIKKCKHKQQVTVEQFDDNDNYDDESLSDENSSNESTNYDKSQYSSSDESSSNESTSYDDKQHSNENYKQQKVIKLVLIKNKNIIPLIENFAKIQKEIQRQKCEMTRCNTRKRKFN